jgi:hypothetical protein
MYVAAFEPRGQARVLPFMRVQRPCVSKELKLQRQ